MFRWPRQVPVYTESERIMFGKQFISVTVLLALVVFAGCMTAYYKGFQLPNQGYVSDEPFRIECLTLYAKVNAGTTKEAYRDSTYTVRIGIAPGECEFLDKMRLIEHLEFGKARIEFVATEPFFVELTVITDSIAAVSGGPVRSINYGLYVIPEAVDTIRIHFRARLHIGEQEMLLDTSFVMVRADYRIRDTWMD